MSLRALRSRRTLSFTALGLVGALALAGCASADESSGSDGTAAQASSDALPQALVDASLEAAENATGGEDLAGASIDIVGITSGPDAAPFEAAMQPFEDATGITIDYSGSQDQANVVSAAVAAGNAPDVVDSQGLGLVLQYAQSGQALSLSDAIGDDVLTESFNPGLLSSATVDGEVYGIWNEADTFQVFYNPDTYNGPTDGSWDDLLAWSEDEAESGTAPWCMGLEAGAGSGFPAQGFIESVFAKKWGAEKLAAWTNGDLPWTSEEVTWAFEQFGRIASSDTLVNGGPQGVVSTSIATFMDGMYTDPQQCQLTLWGNYAAAIVGASNPEAVVPDGLDFFEVPASDERYAGDLDVAGHVTFALNDDPATVAFMKYWASAEAQALIAASGQYTVANVNVPLDAYPNESMRSSAELLLAAENVTPGPASGVPTAVNTAYLSGIMQYVQDPGALASILETIEASKS